MVAVAGMTMVCLPALSVIDEMCGNNQYNSRNQKPKLVLVKHLF
jgi:hypothetical protein